MRLTTRYKGWLWIVPLLAFFFYIQLAGYPLLPTLIVGGAVFTVASLFNLLPVQAVYGGALALLISCPLWRIVDNYALLAHDMSVLRFAAVVHMDDANAMALNAASASFVLFVAGVLAESLRGFWYRIR